MAKNRNREFILDKIFDIVIVGPLGALVAFVARAVWDVEFWKAVGMGSLAIVSALGFVVFLRREFKKQLAKPSRLAESKEMLLKQARKAPRFFISKESISRWKAETEIVIDNIVKSQVSKFERCFQHAPTKDDLLKAVAFLESLESRLHEDDLKKYPDH